LVHITYQPNPNFDPNDENVFLIIEHHFYISMTTNVIPILCNIAYKCVGLTWLKKDMPPLPTLCGQMDVHAKSHKPWYFVGHYLNLIGGCAMIWSFFGTGYGKRVHDGVGAIIKWFL